MKFKIILLFLFLSLIPGYSFSEENFPAPEDLMMSGAFSVGASPLAAIATPFVLPSPLKDAHSPSEAMATISVASSTGPILSGVGILLLLEGAGQKLSEMNQENFLPAKKKAPLDNAPKVALELIKPSGQTVEEQIPLVVRRDFIQMHDQIEIRQ